MPMQMSAYYIAGWGGDWNHREMGNNQYTYYAQTAGDYQFKISEQANWNKQWACGTTVNVSGVVTKNSCNNGDNISVKLTKNADVTISFNGSVITVTATEITAALDAYLKGSFDTWGTGKQMTKNGDQFELKNVPLTADTQLKINYAANVWAGYDQVKSGDKADFCTRGTGGDDNNIIISVTGTYSFYYKQASNEIYMVLESSGDTGGDDGQDSYLEALQCDASNTRIIFTEDFGTFSDIKDRTSYSKSGTGFTAKVPTSSYTAMTTSCTAIKDAGYYAVLANPFYAGCGEQNQGDTHACECNDGQWYQNITDHTGNTNGGMLFYNCRDGKNQTDILYESTVDVCQNTFINFSAYIASATASGRGCDVKAKVRFILYDATSNEELSRYTTDYIPLEEGKWEKIAVMFNSKSASKVTLKLLNLAAEGCGNDLLLDDVTFSVCTPKANLVCSNGTEEFTIIPGQKETLTASIISGVMENPYYLWQYQSNKAGWMPIGQPEVNKTELEVIPEANPTLYRVIIANTASEALNIAGQGNPSACGMYAITNTVTANVTNLGLISNLSDGSICADGVDKNTLTLKVTNPLNVAVTGVKVAVEIPEGVTAYNAGTTTVFTGFAEFDLAANGSKTLTLDLKSTAAITASQIKSIKSYIAKTFNLTWDSASALVKASSDITVNPVPTAKFAVASENICKGSTTIGTNVIISNGSPNYTLTIGGTNYIATTSPYLFAVNPTSTTTYTLTKVMDAKGCYSTPTSNNTVTVNVEEIKITTHPASTSVCVGAGATFSVVASGVDKYQWQVSSDNSNWNNISGATASTYTISATTANDNNKYYRVIVCKNGGKCGQQESNSAMLTVKTTAVPSLTRAEYKECATSGNVQLSTLFSGTGLKFYSDAALTNQVTTFSASEVVTGKKYYATQTINGCTSAATEISVTVLELPKLTLATTDKNAICGTESDSKATLTYQFNGGKAPYTLSVQRTEDGGTTETITPSNLSATGTYTLQPTAKTTYKFTQVEDVNGCVSKSTSGLVDDVVIDVKRLSITSNLNDESVCADKKITYTIGAEGDDIKYQWFQSTDNGASFNKVGTNSSTYTTGNFAIGDKKQYKVVVSQNPEVCSSITSAVSKVTVNDCSSFELAYTSVKNVVCKEDQIELKLTLSNNSDIDATNVTVNISNIANQYFVSSSSTTYNHVAGTWTIASLRKGDSVTLTIILKGTTVVKDVVSVAYISKSGSTTYTETTTQAKDTENITVKGITAKPSVTNYAACPEVGMLNLAEQVTSDKSGLVFYTTEDGLSSKTQVNKNTEGTTTYWVSNTKVGECESPRTKLDITVYPQPTATISGTTAICKGESTNLTIALTGTEKYNIVLSSGDGKSQVTGSSTTIAVSPTETTPYTLTKVEDGNGCPATLSGSAIITVNDVATIADITAPAAICAGSSLALPTPVITTNGSTVTDGKWYLDGAVYTEGESVLYEKNGALLQYKAMNSCGGEIESNKVAIIVKNNATISDITAPAAICAGSSLALPTPVITTNGSTVTNGNWYLDDAIYTEGESVLYEKNGALLQYKAISSCGGEIKSNEVAITVNDVATIADITAPAAICAGSSLALPTPVITYNGSTVTDGKWYLDGAEYTAGTAVPYTSNGKTLQYKATSSCGGAIESNAVTITVNDKATIADITAPEAICAGNSLALPTPVITYNGSTVTDGKWYLDGAEYTASTAVPYTSNGKTLQYKATSSCGGEIKSNEVTVTVDALPEVTFSATDVTLNCTTPIATITASGAYKYEWSYLDQTGATQTKSGSTLALQQTDPEVSSLVTEYTVYGYSENANCKSEEAKTVKVTEDFVKPVVDIKISETADGTIPERLDCYQQNIKLEADLTNNKETIVEYIWSSGSDNNTTLINNPGAYTLQVKGENGCISDVATETIEQNIVKPEVSIESYITDPVTGNIIPTVELTCANNEITLEGTITNAEQYAEDYPNGEFTYLWSDGSTTSSTVAKTPLATSPMEYTLIVKSPNGCLNDVDKAKVTVTENVSAPVLNIESVYKLCPSDTLSVKALSSLLPNTSGVTYKFYDESGEEIEDLYDASSADAITEYYVTGVSANGCQTEKTSFEVDFARNVDFTLTTSQSSMMVGGNETIVEIVPDADSDDAATYVWTANDQELSVDGLQYVDNLYLDTNFKVTASNRCDSDTQEAFVEVLWPTAFTPHNGNGKNDTFAKGMKLMVFNRFYTKIFEGEDGWDGSINGTMNSSKQTAVPGVYFYSVQLPNGEVKKGTIEIIKVD